MYHRSLYQLSDGKLCIYERFHNKNETLRQAACNRMALKLIPDDSKD